jgi:uncharacterized protein YbaA (DUF1428 family)
MAYVDGFVIPLPTKNVPAYVKMAKAAGKVWMEHGALEYRECVGDDLEHEEVFTSFGKPFKLKADETIVFSWIVYKSKAHRKQVLAKVMADPRIADMAPDKKEQPFDPKRMLYGGFKTLVEM